MANTQNNTQALIRSIAAYLAQLQHPTIDQFLDYWPTDLTISRPPPLKHLPIHRQLEQFQHTNGQEGHLIAQLQTATPNLYWGQTYSASDFGPGFLENYGWTELIGPRGPIAAETFLCGFLLLGPHLTYPRHSHAAAEIYIPLTIGSEQITKDNHWRPRPIGVPIYHEPWIPHGTRAGDELLIDLCLWQGSNLTQKSRID